MLKQFKPVIPIAAGLCGYVYYKNKNPAVAKFTYDEVKKHNKENDAWIIIDDLVLDVTKWINKHPGGSNTIMKGVGTDATKMWHSVYSHNVDIALRYFPKFIIGKYKK